MGAYRSTWGAWESMGCKSLLKDEKEAQGVVGGLRATETFAVNFCRWMAYGKLKLIKANWHAYICPPTRTKIQWEDI